MFQNVVGVFLQASGTGVNGGGGDPMGGGIGIHFLQNH
jgi:hypothetical protein